MIIVIGHLGRDPEMRYTPNGQAATSFSVASRRKYSRTYQTGQIRRSNDINVEPGLELGPTLHTESSTSRTLTARVSGM
jgi:hypothetical protein